MRQKFKRARAPSRAREVVRRDNNDPRSAAAPGVFIYLYSYMRPRRRREPAAAPRAHVVQAKSYAREGGRCW